MYFSSAVLRSLGLCPGRLVVVPASQWLWEGVFLCGLLCQSVIRISCYQNYSRNTRPALLSTLLPVSYTPLCARGRQCALSCRRRGRVLGRYRLAQCDGGSAPCAGGALFCFHSCAQARARFNLCVILEITLSQIFEKHWRRGGLGTYVQAWLLWCSNTVLPALVQSLICLCTIVCLN